MWSAQSPVRSGRVGQSEAAQGLCGPRARGGHSGILHIMQRALRDGELVAREFREGLSCFSHASPACRRGAAIRELCTLSNALSEMNFSCGSFGKDCRVFRTLRRRRGAAISGIMHIKQRALRDGELFKREFREGLSCFARFAGLPAESKDQRS
jgi:hypothetical protein